MPAQTRLGDVCTGHGPCAPRPSISASTNVIVNGKGAVRLADTYAVHCTHMGGLAAGSPNVYVNQRQTGRTSDPIDCGSKVAAGSPNVFINDL